MYPTAYRVQSQGFQSEWYRPPTYSPNELPGNINTPTRVTPGQSLPQSKIDARAKGRALRQSRKAARAANRARHTAKVLAQKAGRITAEVPAVRSTSVMTEAAAAWSGLEASEIAAIRLSSYARAASLASFGGVLMNSAIDQAASVMMRPGHLDLPEEWGDITTYAADTASGWSRISQCTGGVGEPWMVGNLSTVYCGPLARTITELPGHWKLAYSYGYYLIRYYAVGLGEDVVIPIYKFSHTKPYVQPEAERVAALEAARDWHFPNYKGPRPAQDPVMLPPLPPMGVQVGSYGMSVRPYRPKNSKPPPRGEREKKYVAGLNNGTLLGKVIGFAGETVDFINAVYTALPNKVKAEYGYRPPVARKIQALYDHWEEINLTKALGAVFIAQVTDRVYGRIGQHYAGANRRLSMYGGGYRIQFQLGPAL